jgi:hypothetical protein
MACFTSVESHWKHDHFWDGIYLKYVGYFRPPNLSFDEGIPETGQCPPQPSHGDEEIHV